MRTIRKRVITFTLGASGQRLILAPSVIDHLEAHRQLSPRDLEAGGQFFADLSGDSVLVKEATGPRPTDRRTRTSYGADRQAEQAEILDRHRRGLHFIGDWHTHPSPHPSPSRLDYESIHDSVRRSAHQLQGFILIVVGTLPAPDGLHVSVNDGSQTFVLTALAAAKDVAPSNG